MPIESGSPSYFDESGLRAPVESIEEGKLYQKVAIDLAQELPLLMHNGKIRPEYFTEDFQRERHFQFSERLSNTLNDWFISDASDELVNSLERSPHHGRDHFRRLEKWYKKAQKEDKAMRSNPNYIYFSPSAFVAMRFHDLLEVWSGQKEGHDAAGGLFAFGYMLQSQGIADKVVEKHGYGGRESFPHNDWVKLAWGAAFICLNHSLPDEMHTTEYLMQHGLLDSKDLLNGAEVMLKEANIKRKREGKTLFASIREFFPEFALISETLTHIKDGTLESPLFTQNEIEGLKKQTRVFAAADKLDSNFPPDLSADRTFLTRPERAFYVRIEGNLSAKDELEERIQGGSRHESPCDLDRLLFEITRTKTFDGVSNSLSYWYAQALREKGKFLNDSITLLLEHNGSGFMSAYDHLERDMTEAVLAKAGYGDSDAKSKATEVYQKDDHKQIVGILHDLGYKSDSYLDMIFRIRKERRDVTGIVNAKIRSVIDAAITPEEKTRIKELLYLARIRQHEGLGWIPGPTLPEDMTPYKGYLLIRLTKLSDSSAV